MQTREYADVAGALGAGMDGGGLLLDESQLGEKFFDLRTGLAGEVLQKFTNYRVRLAIVIEDDAAYGTRFSELIKDDAASAAFSDVARSAWE